MSTDKTRAHYEAMAAEAASGEPAKVDVLALMQLACDMLDTGEFEVDRQTGRDLAAAIPEVRRILTENAQLREAIRHIRGASHG
ncbi:hypothetical protein ISN75_06695 [Dyella marensis]|uniref:hypothetical protein n=1 Tax=Dyella marensis TaxID=500610 RepID=UPI0031E43699